MKMINIIRAEDLKEGMSILRSNTSDGVLPQIGGYEDAPWKVEKIIEKNYTFITIKISCAYQPIEGYWDGIIVTFDDNTYVCIDSVESK